MTLLKRNIKGQYLFLLGFLCFSFFLSQGSVAASVKPLPGDEAFALTVNVDNDNRIITHWKVAPGYYLYAERLQFKFLPDIKADAVFPKTQVKYDANHRSYEIYAGQFQVPIQVNAEDAQIGLTIQYQGCSAAGFCYPPMQKKLQLDLTTHSINQPMNVLPPAHHTTWQSLSQLTTDQNGVANLLSSQNLAWNWLIFIGLGLLLAFTPCVLPMVPILTSIIIGQKTVSTKKAFFLSLSYVLGTAVTYAAAGVLAAWMGSSLQAWLQQPWVIVLASLLLVLLALSLFGLYDLQLPRRLQTRLTQLSNKSQGGSYVNVFLMGTISTLIISPCVTAPLIGVLMYIAQTGNLLLGGSALFAMGIGMGIPLLLIGISAGRYLPKSGSWMIIVKAAFGFLMLGMVIWLCARIFSASVVSLLLSAWFASIAFFVLFYLPRVTHYTWLKTRYSGAAIGASLFLALSYINAPAFVHQWDQPPQPMNEAVSSFTVIHNLAQLNQELSKAQLSHQPVVLDFYADWCASCVSMDKNVFAKDTIKNALSHFVLLRADLTANNDEDEAILKNFNVVAPPTVLFFNNNGKEVGAHRIVGELSANEFLTRLNSFIAARCDIQASC